ncbi:MAG: hypothetical protein ACREQ5_05125 [Candidatus Dormibacteria bacterium]
MSGRRGDYVNERALGSETPAPRVTAGAEPPQHFARGARKRMAPKLDERIESLEARLKQLKARQTRLEARKRALASRRARQDDTRRKILLGATILARVDRGELAWNTVRGWLEDHLVRTDDRALFELPPRIAAAASPGSK